MICTITSNRPIRRCPRTDTSTATNNEGVSPRCPRQQQQSRHRHEVEAGGRRLAAPMWLQPPLGARRYHRACAGYRARYNRKTAIQSGWLLIANGNTTHCYAVYPANSNCHFRLSTFDFTCHVLRRRTDENLMLYVRTYGRRHRYDTTPWPPRRRRYPQPLLLLCCA